MPPKSSVTSAKDLDDFSTTWNTQWENKLELFWATKLFSALPPSEPIPPVKGDDSIIKQELPDLSKSIDKTARASQFYQQASLRLAMQCRVLVHSLQRCMNHFKGKPKSRKLSDHIYKLTFKIACEENLEGDLKRVLRLLESLQGRLPLFYNEPSRFQRMFSNVVALLLAKRPFVEFEDKTVKKVQEWMSEAIEYDQKDLQHQILKSASTIDGSLGAGPSRPSGGPRGPARQDRSTGSSKDDSTSLPSGGPRPVSAVLGTPQAESTRSLFSDSFASTAWGGENPSVRLFANQNDALVEFRLDGPLEPDSTHIWKPGSTFIGSLMPNSAITAANSFVSSDLVLDGAEYGRDLIRVFAFDLEGTLREWVCEGPRCWQTSFAVDGANTNNVSAVCWSAGGYAQWSLFYATENEQEGRRLFEVSVSGGPRAEWSRAREVEAYHNASMVTNHSDKALQSDFIVTTNPNGSDCRVCFMQPLSSSGGYVIGYQFRSLQRQQRDPDRWVSLSHVDPPLYYLDGPAPSYAGLFVDGNFFLHVQGGVGIQGWLLPQGAKKWERLQSQPGASSHLAMVTATGSDSTKHGALQFVFSAAERKVMQTMIFPWRSVTKPVVLEGRYYDWLRHEKHRRELTIGESQTQVGADWQCTLWMNHSIPYTAQASTLQAARDSASAMALEALGYDLANCP